ncbi:hypothetical protein LTR78_008518 [Recurvomyces mirabilis]|uniref:Uncharacterized protein n=1 Tax=Recurvomyces mirabilis TaxID=574656 RepID=A0AAE0WIY3_9PEZI|nr:hypothetical protein LTR78_008518 [Recurvomyces mirabilis]KAK5156269.1 hypothetical protein LTS14_005157 [Recurvomyces mirabilis]
MVVHVEPAAIEIAASPQRVREVVLDFPNLSVWHKGHFKYIKVQGGKSGKELVQGDKLEILLDLGMKFSPVIQVPEL